MDVGSLLLETGVVGGDNLISAFCCVLFVIQRVVLPRGEGVSEESASSCCDLAPESCCRSFPAGFRSTDAAAAARRSAALTDPSSDNPERGKPWKPSKQQKLNSPSVLGFCEN